jgi:diguanylate cyclase (GGDEF)-like protein/PAS domain S-box-containing protein
VATAPLKETRERTYRLLREMEEEESQLLESRSAEQLRTQRILTGSSTLATLSLFVLLAATYVLLRRQWRETQAASRALADSEEKLSTTLHSIGDAVLATDTEGRVTRMNAVAERLTGWTFAEAQGLPVADVFHIVHEQTRASAVIPVSKVLESGEVQAIANHTALIARDGSERPIADSAAPIRDAAGEIRGVVLVFRDVTIERQAQRILKEQNELLDQRVREQVRQLDESEDHLRSVIGNVPALIAYVDAQQRYVYVNDQYRESFASGRDDITGCTVREILGEQRYAIAAPMIGKVLGGVAQHYDWQPFPGVWQVINYAPKRDAQGAVTGYYVLGTDITERKEAEARIQSLNEALGNRVRELKQVSRALRTLSAGNRTMLRATDEHALLHSMCSAIVDAGGYDIATVWYQIDDDCLSLRLMAENGYPGGLAAASVLEATWAGDEYGVGAVAAAIRTNQTSVVQDMLTEPRQGRKTRGLHGYASMIACPLRVGGAVIGALAIYAAEANAFGANEATLLNESADDLAYGISTLRVRAEQRKSREAMHRLAHYDSLTGLPNVTQFTEAITAALDASQEGQSFALLQANIERLSEINDALGFSHGDEMLCEFAARLRKAAPESAMVARLRGDEFAMLLPDSDKASVVEMVEYLREVLAQPFQIADIALDVAAKIGIVLFPEHGTTSHDLYRNMDIAVHLAKARNVGYVVFDPTQTPDHSRRLTIVSELRRAIEGGDLALYLQPKVELPTGRICGAEGLVRWKHATRGIIPPVEFIGLAESTGLIKPLTEWVIEKAMELNQAWAKKGCALPIAVNLSARNLHDERLLENLRHLQATRGIESGLFEIELTESSVMEDAEFALGVLYGLREQGIPLYIDDFGTGYSSLSYLQKLPVQYIKIDQSFVRDMSRNKDSESIVRSTIDLIHDLGRIAVAEGIEDRDSWDRLAKLGCDMGQGYFIAKPMPAETFQAWAATYRSPNALKAGTGRS